MLFRRCVVSAAAMLLALGFTTVISPALGSAAECGPGTVLDPNSNVCVAAQQPPPPPAWNGDLTPYFSVGACVPIPVPFAPSVCAGI